MPALPHRIWGFFSASVGLGTHPCSTTLLCLLWTCLNVYLGPLQGYLACLHPSAYPWSISLSVFFQCLAVWVIEITTSQVFSKHVPCCKQSCSASSLQIPLLCPVQCMLNETQDRSRVRKCSSSMMVDMTPSCCRFAICTWRFQEWIRQRQRNQMSACQGKCPLFFDVMWIKYCQVQQK